MDEIAASLGRTIRQRTTLYREAPAERRLQSYDRPPLLPVTQTPAARRAQLAGAPSDLVAAK
jgi:hypothetical protein